MTFSAGAQAQTSNWALDPSHSLADFQIRHLGVSTVRGSIRGAKGAVLLDEKDITHPKVEVTLTTSTMNTGNERRDQHLKSFEFFDVAKYPIFTFKSTSITGANGKLQMIGDLSLNGVTKSVTLNGDDPAPHQKGKDGKLVSGFSAAGLIKQADFKLAQQYTDP